MRRAVHRALTRPPGGPRRPTRARRSRARAIDAGVVLAGAAAGFALALACVARFDAPRVAQRGGASGAFETVALLLLTLSPAVGTWYVNRRVRRVSLGERLVGLGRSRRR